MVKIVKKDGIVSTYFRRVRTMKLNSVFDTLNFNTSCSEPGVLNWVNSLNYMYIYLILGQHVGILRSKFCSCCVVLSL